MRFLDFETEARHLDFETEARHFKSLTRDCLERDRCLEDYITGHNKSLTLSQVIHSRPCRTMLIADGLFESERTRIAVQAMATVTHHDVYAIF